LHGFAVTAHTNVKAVHRMLGHARASMTVDACLRAKACPMLIASSCRHCSASPLLASAR
jgi:hypothetical protein